MEHGANTTYRDGCRCYACAQAHYEAAVAYKQRKAQGIVLRRSRGVIENAKYPHGTVSCYTNDRCGCDDCKRAWREYHADRKARVAQFGAVSVDAERVRRFVLRANLAGHGSAVIALRSGVERSSVKNIAKGQNKTVRLANAVRIVKACRELVTEPPATPQGAAMAKRLAFERAS